MKWQKAGYRMFTIFRHNSKLQSGTVAYLFTLQGYFLGAVTSLTVLLMDFHQLFFPVLLFIFILAAFHFCEFFAIGVSNPDSLTPDSFLLNHSVAYWIAYVCSIIEFSCRTYFLKYNPMLIVVIGVVVCIVGDSMRKLAMWHAGIGFTHILAYKKKKQHQLVISGVYRFVRHPSYLGFFIFTLGTQLILCNPICFVGFGYICLFKFFRERVYEEERYLVSFFGQNYIQYQKRVPLGLPFIENYNVSN
uniref:Protein-S-isoprenylcysteine O-methyltransferase n=1 Tax=Panagrolaimus sp. JU765 TaxID=591449 RepID=A0AC34QHY3_9BILA